MYSMATALSVATRLRHIDEEIARSVPKAINTDKTLRLDNWAWWFASKLRGLSWERKEEPSEEYPFGNTIEPYDVWREDQLTKEN